MHRTDTDESIRLFEQALAKAPEFPWPSLLLAEIFGWGKRVEKNKAAEYIASFFEKCPHSTNSLALSLVGRFGAPGRSSQGRSGPTAKSNKTN